MSGWDELGAEYLQRERTSTLSEGQGLRGNWRALGLGLIAAKGRPSCGVGGPLHGDSVKVGIGSMLVRWARMRRISSRLRITRTGQSCAPQFGHGSTSWPAIRLIASAQDMGLSVGVGAVASFFGLGGLDGSLDVACSSFSGSGCCAKGVGLVQRLNIDSCTMAAPSITWARSAGIASGFGTAGKRGMPACSPSSPTPLAEA